MKGNRLEKLSESPNFVAFNNFVTEGGNINPETHSLFCIISYGPDDEPLVETKAYVHASDRFAAGAIMGLLAQKPELAQLVMQGIIETFVMPQAVMGMKPHGNG